MNPAKERKVLLSNEVVFPLHRGRSNISKWHDKYLRGIYMQHNTFNTMPTGSKYSLPLTLQKQNETYNSHLVPYLKPQNHIT